MQRNSIALGLIDPVGSGGAAFVNSNKILNT
jgi:hypothetical protein